MRGKHSSGKIVPLLLFILILLIAAAGTGYYLSFLRFDGKVNHLNKRFEDFENKYEKTLSILHSDTIAIKAYLEEKEGKTEEETNRLKMMSILLKAKGEIISGKLAISRDEASKSLEYLDAAIAVLKEAYALANEANKEKIENIRLNLATVKGMVEVNAQKAQQEMERLWRQIDILIEE